MPYERFENGKLILRDELAIDRTRLANERTFLAYLRTALALAIVGGTCVHFSPDSSPMLLVGIFFLIAGVICFLIGTWKTISMTKAINLIRKNSKQAKK